MCVCFAVQNEDQQIGLKFSLKLPTMPLHHVGSGQLGPIQIQAVQNWWIRAADSSSVESEYNDFADSDISIIDFQNFYSQINTECNVDYKQKVLNVAQFWNPPI